MKKLKFNIPIYDVDVMLVQLEKDDTKKDLLLIGRWAGLAQNDLDDVFDALKRGAFYGGDTWRNFAIHKILVTFYPMKDEMERAEVYSHEKRHIEDRVMEWVNVQDVESAGLLAGFLGRKFYEFNKIINNK